MDTSGKQEFDDSKNKSEYSFFSPGDQEEIYRETGIELLDSIEKLLKNKHKGAETWSAGASLHEIWSQNKNEELEFIIANLCKKEFLPGISLVEDCLIDVTRRHNAQEKQDPSFDTFIFEVLTLERCIQKGVDNISQLSNYDYEETRDLCKFVQRMAESLDNSKEISEIDYLGDIYSN